MSENENNGSKKPKLTIRRYSGGAFIVKEWDDGRKSFYHRVNQEYRKVANPDDENSVKKVNDFKEYGETDFYVGDREALLGHLMDMYGSDFEITIRRK